MLDAVFALYKKEALPVTDAGRVSMIVVEEPVGQYFVDIAVLPLRSRA